MLTAWTMSKNWKKFKQLLEPYYYVLYMIIERRRYYNAHDLRKSFKNLARWERRRMQKYLWWLAIGGICREIVHSKKGTNWVSVWFKRKSCVKVDCMVIIWKIKTGLDTKNSDDEQANKKINDTHASFVFVSILQSPK